MAAKFGVGKLTRHPFICRSGRIAPDLARGEQTWEYLKKRLKELNLAGPDGPCYRTKCQCLRICTAGPVAVVYPEGTWYQKVTPENAERIIQGAPDWRTRRGRTLLRTKCARDGLISGRGKAVAHHYNTAMPNELDTNLLDHLRPL